ncbi:hypothetical protein DAPPUDRAFT_248408 [Daphnia pulex]|uniref:Uncharacterized protein n=1 Tax=Daphnia pulex TaxID=6669 RepID=E9GUL5_DAPPU|nr:hypothetical protein DAPPUDRAFT_248408 [Daphnia pulex]|eukprot:EFX76747.1 hypothetical protein DAPPUDRAFT_248408 [Daphnia pulex]
MNEPVAEPNKFPTEMFEEQTTMRNKDRDNDDSRTKGTMMKQNGGSRPRAEMTQHFNALLSFFSFVR